MKTELIRQVLEKTEAGHAVFPEVVGVMMEAGVESYFTDFLRGDHTYYGAAGGTHVEHSALVVGDVAKVFAEDAVIAAIRGAQADRVRYPEFVRLVKAAGCVGYRVHVIGKRVHYFGREGEVHTEWFPGAQP